MDYYKSIGIWRFALITFFYERNHLISIALMTYIGKNDNHHLLRVQWLFRKECFWRLHLTLFFREFLLIKGKWKAKRCEDE